MSTDTVTGVRTRHTYLVETILKEISDVVSSIDDIQAVMDQLVCLATSLLGVGNCSLVLIEPDTDRMRIRASHGISKEVAQRFNQRVGEGITGYVAKTGKALLIEDVEHHPLFQRKSSSRYTTKSLLSVPLISQRKVIGVLNVNNRNDGGIFTRSDELLLSVLANLVVIAIEKATMHHKLIETERYEADLRIAREIQETMLPRTLPSEANWQFAARNIPARSVAGDFFDFIMLPNNRTCVVLGDVCGKGIPAALYMARVLSYFRVVAQLRNNVSEIMSSVNDLLAAEWTERTFVTACCCLIDNETSTVSFCSAGHLEPYFLRESSGEVKEITIDHGLPLGIEVATSFKNVDIVAEPGDNIILFTDGVTEARNPEGQMFRTRRLTELLKMHRGSPATLADNIIAALAGFAKGEPQSDDITLVVMKRQ